VSPTIKKVVLVAVALFVAGAIFWQNRRSHSVPSAPPLTANASAPHFSLPALDGQSIDSASFKGKVVLVDFWATWCVPCQSEIPHFIDWQSRHSADGLQVVGISMDDTVSPVKTYVQEHKVNYPIAMADEKTIAAFGGVLGLPANILIGRDGKLIIKHVGVTDISVLQREVEQALATK
jgi:peroxiredoxin